ncbi:MAG: ABC transporter substrate-binding protein [bacterium]|nr:ABC transporter substrate-binding protein [bacterium]
MKRRIVAIGIMLMLLLVSLSGCGGSSDVEKVTLNEVAHSIFYAPMYAAIELGYFEEQGIDLTLVNGLGADKTMTAVLSGEADIGFMGSETTIYVYQQGKKDYVQSFAQLTQRAGNFLVARSDNAAEEFDWNTLKNKTVLGGREGGMPEMVFEYILKQKGIDPKNDLNIVQNIDFGHTAEAFTSGQGDYTVEFEPSANALEVAGKGKVVASLGVESGNVPYTSFCAKKSYIEENQDIIRRFTNAIQQGMDYVQTHTPEEIAQVISPQFRETDMQAIINIVTRYYEQGTWKENTVFEKESFELLKDILKSAGQLEKDIPYEDLVVTDYSINAVK